MDLSILVIGTENPRIRDFFSQVGRYARVSYLDVAAVSRNPDFDKLAKSWRWRKNGDEIPEATLMVPRRWHNVSASMAEWFLRKTFARSGKPDVVVFTWPQLAYLAERLTDVTRVYYCKDPFEYWSWGRDYIRPYETRLLENVDAVFAISRLIVSDFETRTRAKRYYLPNGFCDWFLPSGQNQRPMDLPLDVPIVGSVGQINRDYDWPYVEAVANALPDVRFVFLGRIDDDAPPVRRDIARIFREHPNLIWLGWRKYQLMPAYMRSFDVLINFLRADAFGDRRSPLRLYDYLTTDRPIITTPVAEAYEHVPHVHIAKGPGDAIVLIKRMLAGQHKPDMGVRQAYTQTQSWDNRAKEFLAEVEKLVEAKRAKAAG
jgi:hypothetical protein